MVKVLFVCLGNICRSPMAEGVFKHLVENRKLQNKIACDSAGTSSYHIGQNADARMSETALSHGIQLDHKARQFTEFDFEEFDYILAMDTSNMYEIRDMELSNDGNYDLLMMREFDEQKESLDVPDPYYGGDLGFENVYQIMDRSCTKLLDQIVLDHNL